MISTKNSKKKDTLWRSCTLPIKRRSISVKVCLYLSLATSLVNITSAEEQVSVKFAFSNSDRPTSYVNEQNQVEGILPDLVALAFDNLPDYQLTMKAYPWRRAKANVIGGQMDGLITYPSESLITHINFTDKAIYLIDYGYVVYSIDNIHASKLNSIQNVTGLKDLVLISDSSPGFNSWDEENLPSNIYRRIYAKNIKIAFHLLFKRKAGDYLIRNPEESISIAKALGYQDQIRFRKIDLPSHNIIPFHIGIRKSHRNSETLITSLNQLLESEAFQLKSNKLIKRYQRVK